MTKSPLLPNRSSGGKRWSPDEDNRLLEYVQQKEDWVDIAKALSRTFVSVQNRFRFLKSSRASAFMIVAATSTRAEHPDLAPDLTCGAVSRSAREVLTFVKTDIGRLRFEAREIIGPFDETDLMIGAIIREVLLVRLRTDTGWLRITVSRVNSAEIGMGREALRSILDDLEKRQLLERYVGYPDLLALTQKSARRGRLVLVRASSRLVDLCERQGISGSDLFTHFPSLGR